MLAEFQTDEVKRRFAAACLRFGRSYDAALSVLTYPGNEGDASVIAHRWTSDPVVMAELARLRKDAQPLELVPTKEDIARELWGLAKSERATISEKRTCLTDLATLLGYVDKSRGGTNVTVNQNNGTVVHHTQVVQSFGSEEEFERRSVAAQRALIEADAQRVG